MALRAGAGRSTRLERAFHLPPSIPIHEGSAITETAPTATSWPARRTFSRMPTLRPSISGPCQLDHRLGARHKLQGDARPGPGHRLASYHSFGNSGPDVCEPDQSGHRQRSGWLSRSYVCQHHPSDLRRRGKSAPERRRQFSPAHVWLICHAVPSYSSICNLAPSPPPEESGLTQMCTALGSTASSL